MRIISDGSLGIITVWQEAEGEDLRGKTMVAEVIQERARRSGKSVGEVVLKLKQFSEWNENDPRSIRSLLLDDEDPAVQECAAAWYAASEGSQHAKGATHYHAAHVRPWWADKMTEVARHGNHVFYVEA